VSMQNVRFQPAVPIFPQGTSVDRRIPISNPLVNSLHKTTVLQDFL